MILFSSLKICLYLLVWLGVQHIHTGASTAASTGLLLCVTFSLPLWRDLHRKHISRGVLKRPLKRTKGKIWDIWGVFNPIPRYSPHTSPHCTELFNTETPLPSLLWTPWELCAAVPFSLKHCLKSTISLAVCLLHDNYTPKSMAQDNACIVGVWCLLSYWPGSYSPPIPGLQHFISKEKRES